MLVVFIEPVSTHYDQHCEGVNGIVRDLSMTDKQ